MTCDYYLQACCTMSPMIPPLSEQSFPLACSDFEMCFNQQQRQKQSEHHTRKGERLIV